MNTLTPMLLMVLLCLAHAPGHASGQQQDRAMCQYSAEHMIEVAKHSLAEKRSRPERIEKRRQLVEQWTARMKKGEDPCKIFADIQKASTTF